MVKDIVRIVMALRFFWKIYFLRIIGCRHIKTKRISLACKYSTIECDRNSILTIGSKACLSQGTLLAVRKCARIHLGDNVFINRNCIIVSHNSILIKNGVTIGPNCCIYDHDHDLRHRGEFVTAPITIGENVWLGANVLIMKGVSIGDNSVIGAGCVITHDIPSKTAVIQKRIDSYYEVPCIAKN